MQTAASNLMQTLRGFMQSRIILTGAELDLFSLLSRSRLNARQVADELQTDLRATQILLDALTAIGLLRKANGVYESADEARSLLSSDSPESILPIVLHLSGSWKLWSRLTDIVQGEVAIPTDDFRTEAQLRAFIGGMHVVSRHQAPGVIQRIGADGASRVLDIGGASGTYTIAFLRANPGLRATLFDRPAVVEMARERLGAEGLLDRVDLVGGDYNTDPLPAGHDLAFLSAIIHQNSPEQNLDLYTRCHAALNPGGRIIVRDYVLSPDRTSPPAGALFAINMLCATRGGNSYTMEEISLGLVEAGFSRPRLIHNEENHYGLVEAWKA